MNSLSNNILLNEDLRENIAAWARLNGRKYSAQDFIDFCN